MPAETPKSANPPCTNCRHSKSFHKKVKKAMPCQAYGCKCSDFTTEAVEQ